MDVYLYSPQTFNWTEYISEEQSRLLLALTWLVRADVVRYGEANAEHVGWLYRVTADYLQFQNSFGGIQEQLGQNISNCLACPPRANGDYATGEAPIIEVNTDTCTDLLYSNNFALISLWEAYKATGDFDTFGKAADLLANYLLSVQGVSVNHPELDGGWIRAFDYELWTQYGSDSDTGWGANSLESGWTQTWIDVGFAFRALNTSYWDFTSTAINSTVFYEECAKTFGSCAPGQ
jgi:hypothetical protein